MQANLKLETKQIEMKSTTLKISRLEKDLEFSEAKYVDLESEIESKNISNLKTERIQGKRIVRTEILKLKVLNRTWL